MDKPSPELIEAFFEWFRNDPHSQNEDFYQNTISKEHLDSLSRDEFIGFFFQFARDGGKLQSGGHRTAPMLKDTMEEKYEEFHKYVLEPFESGFSDADWLEKLKFFKGFGQGIATIYLNRVDKARFAVLNNKTADALKLFRVGLSSDLVKRYMTVKDAQHQLIEWYPEFENFYRADAINHFLVGTENGKPWKKMLEGLAADPGPGVKRRIISGPKYWIYAPGGGARFWDKYYNENLMGIGWDDFKEDLSNYKSEQDLWDRYLECYGDKATDVDFGMLYDFLSTMKEGDHVFVKKGIKELVGYGRVSSGYFYDENRPEHRHLRKAEWLKRGQWMLPEGIKTLPQKTLTELDDEARIQLFLQLIETPEFDPRPGGDNLPYTLEDFASETHFDLQEIRRWVRAVHRKSQVIFYGPPGTGKTFVAEKLARHLIGGGDGFREIIQFHPSYAYEDFLQGLRPKAAAVGGLEYLMVPGRFKDFCSRASARKGICVLIIDEINRANLSRVFGELMYLLEYRKESIPLAGGARFQIPENIRIIGTMNTADRSIALVDHALRRRFAFLGLYPNYDVLRKYHASTGFDPAGLISVLDRINAAISDRHYAVGISFFLQPKVEEQLQDIWQMDIEPYIEELFFDQPEKAAGFTWSKVRNEISNS